MVWIKKTYKKNGHQFEIGVGKGKTNLALDKLSKLEELSNNQYKIFGVADEAQRRAIFFDNGIENGGFNYVDCPRDMVVYPKNNVEEIGIVLNSEDLLNINKKTRLHLGSITLPDEQKEFKGEQTIWLKKSDLIFNRELTFDEYMDHKGWSILLRDPKIEDIPEEITTHRHFKEYYGSLIWNLLGKDIKKDKAMGFFILEQPPENLTVGKQFCLFGNNNNGNVYADKNSNFDNEYGRVIAVHNNKYEFGWKPSRQLEYFLNSR